VAVIRFEFAYMAARRTGARKSPPRAERLTAEYMDAVSEIGTARPLFIGGKSMGGRVASLVAGDLHHTGAITGLVCLGYPFHPPAKPTALRTAHLEKLAVPALICQGTRDPFGTREEVPGYAMSKTIEIAWLEDGDHDFKPRKASGLTQAGNIGTAAATIAKWMRSTVAAQS
ncbi:MAG TPA: alpha/beta family hydrolase, partial [Afifellaceae bacterium]|nr:alpha/beta family hydrolase [Afifellaceae bacterium]